VIITKKALPRRTFLKGVGATIALPLLDAMTPALSALSQTAARPPLRAGFVFVPMGASMEYYTPPGEGKLTELSPILDSLAPHKDYLTVVTNLQIKPAYTAGSGNHATSNCCFLTCAPAKATSGIDFYLATTVDQFIAQKIGRDTQLPSLELSTDLMAQVGNCDDGYACAYMNYISWSSPTTPNPTEADPRVVFERLFGEGGNSEQRKVAMAERRSILDSVVEDLARLQRKVGAADRTKIDQYLTSVRELERRIEKAEEQRAEQLPDLQRPLAAPGAGPDGWEEHVRIMYEFQALALQGDITRVITFQKAREVSTRVYPQIGVSDPHHPLSHHQEDPVKIAKLAKINAYHMSLFAEFIGKLKAIPEGDGNLLDHTMYFYGSGMGNPSAHDHTNIPIAILGKADGRIKGGQHVRYPKPTALANLHWTILDRYGVRLDKFADSNEMVQQL
jgi:hypothetical protein